MHGLYSWAVMSNLSAGKLLVAFCFVKYKLSYAITLKLKMLCLSVLCFSRDHFNHLCSIKGKIDTIFLM